MPLIAEIQCLKQHRNPSSTKHSNHLGTLENLDQNWNLEQVLLT